MPGIDDRLRRDLERLAGSHRPEAGIEDVVRRKELRRTFRRLQVAALVLVVLAGSGVGSYALLRALDFRKVAGGSETGLIAFINIGEGQARLSTLRPDGTDVRVLTSGPYADSQPAWSPDGTRLAFVRQRVEHHESLGPTPGPIWIVRADGTGLVELTHGPFDREPTWSPDGSAIAFVAGPQRAGISIDQAGWIGATTPHAGFPRRRFAHVVPGRVRHRLRADPGHRALLSWCHPGRHAGRRNARPRTPARR